MAKSPRIVIVGAGIAGIATGVALKRQLRAENFTIFEKASTVGGTWRDNTYPGCGSDIPAHWYSLSTELNPNWTKFNVGQPEIQAYWEAIYHKHGLDAHSVFNTSVILAEWDNAARLYSITLKNNVTGEQTKTEAEVMIWAVGGYQDPMFPKDIPGAEKFHGTFWHSARWRHDVDLKGKRVGVIGNACSATQFVPEISKDPEVEVLNFCRTPQWYIPGDNYSYPALVKWMFKYIPCIMRSYRNFLVAKGDVPFLGFVKTNTLLVKLVTQQLTKYIKQSAPKEELENLIPKYPPGCKRIVFDSGYLSSLSRPNVSLNWNPIQEIVEEGVKLKTGEIIPLDAIVFATGYSMEADVRVRGSNGSMMHEYFATQGGSTAYIGTCMPGFPNLIRLIGPNVLTGHSSAIFQVESQIQLAIQLIKPVLEGRLYSFEVSAKATDDYNAWLQQRLSKSVWTECNSYYYVGGDRKAKNTTVFPGASTLFWWMTRKPRWDHFKTLDVEHKGRKLVKGKRWVLMALLMVVAYYVFAKVGPVLPLERYLVNIYQKNVLY